MTGIQQTSFGVPLQSAGYADGGTLPLAVNTVTASAAAVALPDARLFGANVVTLTANCAITAPPAVVGATCHVALVQDTTGSRTVTWSPNVQWANGTAPTITATAGARDLITLVCLDGTTWIGRVTAANTLPTALTWPTVTGTLLARYQSDSISALNTVPASGTSIGTWVDLSGNSRNVTAAGAAQPTYTTATLTPSGKGLVSFTAAQQMAVASAFTIPADPITVFLVCRPTAGGGYPFTTMGGPYCLVDGDGTLPDGVLLMGSTSANLKQISTPDWTNPPTTVLGSLVVNGASSALYINGVQSLTGSLTNTSGSRTLTLGYSYVGAIGALAIFQGALSNADRVAVENYYRAWAGIA